MSEQPDQASSSIPSPSSPIPDALAKCVQEAKKRGEVPEFVPRSVSSSSRGGGGGGAAAPVRPFYPSSSTSTTSVSRAGVDGVDGGSSSFYSGSLSAPPWSFGDGVMYDGEEYGEEFEEDEEDEDRDADIVEYMINHDEFLDFIQDDAFTESGFDHEWMFDSKGEVRAFFGDREVVWSEWVPPDVQSSNSFGNSEDRSEREQKFSSVENKDSSSVFSSYPSSSVFQPQIGNELTPASVDAVLKEIDSLLKISREMLDRWHPSPDHNEALNVIQSHSLKALSLLQDIGEYGSRFISVHLFLLHLARRIGYWKRFYENISYIVREPLPMYFHFEKYRRLPRQGEPYDTSILSSSLIDWVVQIFSQFILSLLIVEVPAEELNKMFQEYIRYIPPLYMSHPNVKFALCALSSAINLDWETYAKLLNSLDSNEFPTEVILLQLGSQSNLYRANLANIQGGVSNLHVSSSSSSQSPPSSS